MRAKTSASQAWVDIVQAACGDDGQHDGGTIGPTLGTGEGPVFPSTALSILSSSISILLCYHARDPKSRGPPRMDTYKQRRERFGGYGLT